MQLLAIKKIELKACTGSKFNAKLDFISQLNYAKIDEHVLVLISKSE